MNELKIFNNPEFGEIRTININGEPWMVGKDVAAVLGYQNPSKALAGHFGTARWMAYQRIRPVFSCDFQQTPRSKEVPSLGHVRSFAIIS